MKPSFFFDRYVFSRHVTTLLALLAFLSFGIPGAIGQEEDDEARPAEEAGEMPDAAKPGAAAEQPEEKPREPVTTVEVARKASQPMFYGMDFERLWDWVPTRLAPTGLLEKERLMQLAVGECKVHYVRVAINSASELDEGVFVESAYKEILEVMTLCKAANPDINFFASPRPIKEAIKGAPWSMFPLWISGDEMYINSKGETKWKKGYFNPEKAGDYMVRYLEFMESKGFKITYMDLSNESCGRLRPAAQAIMAKRIREARGDKAPLLLAPSSFDYGVAESWLDEAGKWPGLDFFDIVSTHNTRGENSGDLNAFASRVRKTKKPLWNSEFHAIRGPDNIAVSNMQYLFKQVRGGVSGINDWLSLGSEKKDYKMFRTMGDGSLEVMRIYYIYKQLVNTSNEGHYFATTIPDGLTTTLAFIRGKLMTVWLLNANETAAEAVPVTIGNRRIEGETLKTLSWTPDNGREGTVGELQVASENSFTVDVGAQSLICLEFNLK